MVPNKPPLVSGFFRTARKRVISYSSPPADAVLSHPSTDLPWHSGIPATPQRVYCPW